MLTSGFFHFFFCVLQDLIDLVAYITYRLYHFSKYQQFFTHKLNIGIVVATMWTFNDMNITNSINKDHRKSDHIRQTWQLLILLMANIIFVTWRSFYCSTPKLKMINYFSLFFLYPHSTYGKDWHRNRFIKSSNQKVSDEMSYNITSQTMKIYIEDIDLGICANELRFLMNLT